MRCVGFVATSLFLFQAASAQDGTAIDFYGKKITLLKVFGHSSYKEFADGRVTHERTFMSKEYPVSPVSVAFNSRNEMVVGNDGYYNRSPDKRIWNQLYVYRKPLQKATPDAVIEVPLGGVAEITFDRHDNLIALDATYCHKV